MSQLTISTPSGFKSTSALCLLDSPRQHSALVCSSVNREKIILLIGLMVRIKKNLYTSSLVAEWIKDPACHMVDTAVAWLPAVTQVPSLARNFCCGCGQKMVRRVDLRGKKKNPCKIPDNFLFFLSFLGQYLQHM